MEFFYRAKAVRLKSHHHNKYLVADEDEESVLQSRDGASHNAHWTVEFVKGEEHHIRLKSCYGKYLAASDERFPLSLGKKVVQDSVKSSNERSIEWEPKSESYYIKLMARGGKFLRANGGMPPWRNSITHDVPHRTSTQDWVLWEVDVLDIVEEYY